MKLSEIRIELLEQHAELRRLIQEMQEAAECWRREGTPEGLYAVLGRLSVLVRTHNAREEELLRGVIRGIDAWGPARAEAMLDEHAKEHDELLEGLLETGATLDAAVAIPALSDLATRMLQHMEREEKTFLGEDVLRDELDPPTDYFGG